MTMEKFWGPPGKNVLIIFNLHLKNSVENGIFGLAFDLEMWVTKTTTKQSVVN